MLVRVVSVFCTIFILIIIIPTAGVDPNVVIKEPILHYFFFIYISDESLYLSQYLSLSLTHTLSLSLSISHSLFLALSLSLSPSLSLLHISLPLFLSLTNTYYSFFSLFFFLFPLFLLYFSPHITIHPCKVSRETEQNNRTLFIIYQYVQYTREKRM